MTFYLIALLMMTVIMASYAQGQSESKGPSFSISLSDIQGCSNGSVGSCGSSIAGLLKPFFVWSSDSVYILNMSCRRSMKSRIRKLQVVWDAKFWCPSLSGNQGTGSGHKSPSTALEMSIVDYFNKNAHLLSQAQLAQLASQGK